MKRGIYLLLYGKTEIDTKEKFLDYRKAGRTTDSTVAKLSAHPHIFITLISEGGW